MALFSKRTVGIYVSLFSIMLILHSVMGILSDDVSNQHELDNCTLFQFVAKHFMTTNARVLINGSIVVLARTNLWLWRVLDSVVFTAVAFLINKLFTSGSSSHKAIVCCGLILLFPLYVLDSAGWIASSLTYVWPVFCGLLASIPLIKTETSWISSRFILLIPLMFCANQEQYCLIIITLVFVYLIFTTYPHRVNWYTSLFVFICLSFFLMSIICPGNTLRYNVEMSLRWPTFNELTFFQKISLGIVSSAIKLFSFDFLYLFFSVSMTFAAFIVKKNRVKTLLLCILPFCVSAYLTLFYDYTFFNLIKGNFVENFCRFSSSNLEYLFILVFGLISVAIWTWCLWTLFERKPFVLLLFFTGIGSRIALAFSPTLFASGFRTMAPLYFCLIIIMAMLYDKILSKANMKFKTIYFGLLFLFISLNMLVFLVTFWYIPFVRDSTFM